MRYEIGEKELVEAVRLWLDEWKSPYPDDEVKVVIPVRDIPGATLELEFPAIEE